MLVSESIARFLTHVSSDREASTVKSYRSRLLSLSKALGPLQLDRMYAEEDKPSPLAAWLESTKTFADGRDKAPDTIRLTMTALDLWQAWLIKEKHIAARFIEKQRKPSGRQRDLLPEPEETRALLEHVTDDFKVALRVLRLTGCRPGELCRMRIEEFDRRQMLIILPKHKTVKKTERPRVIAVAHPSLIELITDAIGERESGPIFLRASGKPWTVEALSANYRKARKAAGLQPGLVLYLSRHEHATQLYEATEDIHAVASALGHTNIMMASRYARATPAVLKRNQSHFKEGL